MKSTDLFPGSVLEKVDELAVRPAHSARVHDLVSCTHKSVIYTRACVGTYE